MAEKTKKKRGKGRGSGLRRRNQSSGNKAREKKWVCGGAEKPGKGKNAPTKNTLKLLKITLKPDKSYCS